MTNQEIKDLKVLAQFTSVYCKVHHQGEKRALQPHEPDLKCLPLHKYLVCDDCGEFLRYAFERRIRCPLAEEERPSCKHCHIHCYRPGHREKVREIMRFAGPYLIKRGRFDLLWHYLF